MLRCFRFAVHQKDISRGKSLARGSTPLHRAAYNGEVEVVKLLLEAKASVTVKDKHGRGASTGRIDGCLLTVWQLSLFADC